MQDFYEKLEEKKDWRLELTKAEGLVKEFISEAVEWNPWN